MVLQVGINGLGRVGRIIFRTGLMNPNIEISAINDPALEVEYICYLIKFDSTHGPLVYDITHNENDITINGKLIKVFHEKRPENIPWQSAGVQYVIEASGMFTSYDKAAGHLTSHTVRRVLVTAPSADIPMLILGVNDDAINPDEGVVSCASSTLYCLAPMIKILHERFGVSEGFITSIHSMTPSLKPLDGLCLKGKHWRDHRSIHQNIIPANTSACRALGKIIPGVKDRLMGMAFRVPIVDVSVLDLTLRLNTATNIEEVINEVEKCEKYRLKNVIKLTYDQSVSSDFIGDSHSCILDVNSSQQLKPKFLKLVCWYENEYSYACRTIDTILYLENLRGSRIVFPQMRFLDTKTRRGEHKLSLCRARESDYLSSVPPPPVLKKIPSAFKATKATKHDKGDLGVSKLLNEPKLTRSAKNIFCQSCMALVSKIKRPNKHTDDLGKASKQNSEGTINMNSENSCGEDKEEKAEDPKDNIPNTDVYDTADQYKSSISEKIKNLKSGILFDISGDCKNKINNFVEVITSLGPRTAPAAMDIQGERSTGTVEMSYTDRNEFSATEDEPSHDNDVMEAYTPRMVDMETSTEAIETDKKQKVFKSNSSNMQCECNWLQTNNDKNEDNHESDNTKVVMMKSSSFLMSEGSSKVRSSFKDYVFEGVEINIENGVQQQSGAVQDKSAWPVEEIVRDTESTDTRLDSWQKYAVSKSRDNFSICLSFNEPVKRLKDDLLDKLDSPSASGSDNSFQIYEKKSQVIKITDLTNSLHDLDRLDKICRIIEISDELSDQLFSSLKDESNSEKCVKQWSFKDLCDKIQLDDFCHKLFGGSSVN